jgi:hypothetical protein
VKAQEEVRQVHADEDRELRREGAKGRQIEREKEEELNENK